MDMSVQIDAPPEAVWPYLVDWENLNKWMLEGSGFTVTSPHRTGLGVEAEAKIKIGGISTIDRVRVTGWDPPSFLEITHLAWVKGKGIMHAEIHDRSTIVSWKEIFIPPWGIVGAIGMRIFAPLMKRIFKRDLSILKSLVESEPPG